MYDTKNREVTSLCGKYNPPPCSNYTVHPKFLKVTIMIVTCMHHPRSNDPKIQASRTKMDRA